MLPMARTLPFTAWVATPDADNEALPRGAPPIEKVTLPVGTAVPLAAFTVAVSWVVAVDAMVDGLAATDVVVVTTTGAVTVTVADPDELAKDALPA